MLAAYALGLACGRIVLKYHRPRYRRQEDTTEFRSLRAIRSAASPDAVGWEAESSLRSGLLSKLRERNPKSGGWPTPSLVRYLARSGPRLSGNIPRCRTPWARLSLTRGWLTPAAEIFRSSGGVDSVPGWVTRLSRWRFDRTPPCQSASSSTPNWRPWSCPRWRLPPIPRASASAASRSRT